MSAVARFWRRITWRSFELCVFWAVLGLFSSFSADSAWKWVVLVAFCVVIAVRTVLLAVALIGYWSITSRVRKERNRRGGA